MKDCNPMMDIVILSILPTRTNKMANQLVEQVNELLKLDCSNITASSTFFNIAATWESLYSDEVHLNKSGCKKLAGVVVEALKIQDRESLQNDQRNPVVKAMVFQMPERVT